MDDSSRLTQAHDGNRDPAAFATWVRRHVDLVHSAAQRHAGGNAHQAQEITQMVFLTAFRKAASLARHPAPLAWLHQATRHAASELRRTESRRRLPASPSRPPRPRLNWSSPRLRPPAKIGSHPDATPT